MNIEDVLSRLDRDELREIAQNVDGLEPGPECFEDDRAMDEVWNDLDELPDVGDVVVVIDELGYRYDTTVRFDSMGRLVVGECSFSWMTVVRRWRHV